MRRIVTRTLAVAVAGVGLKAALGPGSRGRAELRRARERLARRARHQRRQWAGVGYRLRRRRPDPDVEGGVLADRIRSSLGPLQKRLDLPHVHVMAEGHTVLLHGEVATAGQAEEVEAAVAAVSGVEGVESFLHVGLLAGDTRPSAGADHQPPSDALRRLLDAATGAGAAPAQARRAVGTVLSAFLERLPADERDQVTAHLPTDVRRLASAPRRLGTPDRPARTVADLVGRVATADGLATEVAEPITSAVLAALRTLVPEEAADVAAVLPEDLRQFWLATSAG